MVRIALIRPENISCREVAELSDEVCQSSVVTPDLCDDDVLVTGQFSLSRMRSGLVLHATDLTEQHDLAIDIKLEPSIAMFLVLEGSVEFSAGEKTIRFGAADVPDSAPEPEGRIIAISEPTLVRRHSKIGQHTRKIKVTVDRDWIADSLIDDPAEKERISEFAKENLGMARWQPSLRAIVLAEQILNPPELPPFLKTVYLESRAMELVMNGFQSLAGQLGKSVGDEFPSRNLVRIQNARSFIDENLDRPLCLAEIARHAGVSISSLQRHFKTAVGSTVLDYARTQRLWRARDALEKDSATVSEAAYLAGYNSSSSFATAFKREFGISPKTVRS